MEAIFFELFLDFGKFKSIFAHIDLTTKNCHESILRTSNKFNKKGNAFDQTISLKAASHQNIYYMISRSIYYNYTEFFKYCMNFYRVISVLFKKLQIFWPFFSFNKKAFYAN